MKDADLFAIPRKHLARFVHRITCTDTGRPPRDWSRYEVPAEARKKVNVAQWRMEIARRQAS